MATATKTRAKSTAVVKKPASVPVPSDAMERMKADIAALQSKLAAAGGDGIQVTQDKGFKFPDSNEKLDSFKAIIVDFVSFNAYYEGKYDKDNVVPPNCFALGTVKNDELVASDNSPDAQNEEGGHNCKTCWANQFKSADNGKGKACKQSIKLALLCEDGELHRLNISSTGLKDFGVYVRDVASTFGTPPYAVMTTFSFDPKSDYPSVRCSEPLRLNDDQLGLVFAKKDEALAMLMVEPDTAEFEEKVVGARAKAKKASTSPAGRARRAA